MPNELETTNNSDISIFKKRVLANNFKHKHISHSKLETVKQHINLLELLVWWDRSSIKYGNGQFVLAADEHSVIYDNMVYNHYTGEMYHQVDTLQMYYGLTYPQSYYVCSWFLYKVSKKPIREYIDKCLDKYNSKHGGDIITDDLNYILDVDLLHSPSSALKNEALAKAYFYLVKIRHIDRDLISHLIHNRYLAMDLNNNLCFLTYRDNEVISITKKGSNPYFPFKQNNVKEQYTGFFYGAKNSKYQEIYVFESVVDLLSYITLEKQGLVSPFPTGSCFISCNGVSTKYLHKVLTANPSIEKVHICFDNDLVGNEAAAKFIYTERKTICGNSVTADFIIQPLMEKGVKDWNEYLKAADSEIAIKY